MKLYSRVQVVKFSIIVFVLAVFFTSMIFLACSKKTGIKSENNSSSDGKSSEKSAEYGETGNKSHLESILETNDSSIREYSENFGMDFSQYSQEEAQNIYVYEMCNEAVVNITTKVMNYNWFLEPYVQDGGSGSGSIIDKRGYILTNVHVIQGASEIYVSLFDGSQYKAEVVGTDLDSDLAVIKFEPPKNMEIKTIPFGKSEDLKVGQRVIAIGNPFGLERTMTTGIVSGLGRPIQNSNQRIIRDMVQTDAAINPGNSGGPLLDTAGRMIGINTMIKSSSGSSAGVGFAVPSETAVRVVADLLEYGEVRRGVIQANIIQLNKRIAQYAGYDISQGVMISEVTENGNAEKAGLCGGTEAAYYGSRRDIIYLGGDVIIKIDDIDITSLADYYSALESKRPGDSVMVTVRRNKKNIQMKVVLAE
ncbi:MAG: trypsin-like peptidase domain-containing protein [Treponema sp.]|nr:trypsin-like peptidase domain-containing protein [Spirochaetales bacterium]MDY6190656.1 trypsin-like peptidase domain-containing protein [Treponema sp.]